VRVPPTSWNDKDMEVFAIAFHIEGCDVIWIPSVTARSDC